VITAEQRELRRKYLGSSDAPAVLGVDAFKTIGDVYLDKTGQVTDFEGNAATERGNLLEPVLLTWAERELGAKLRRNVFVEPVDGLPLAANLDGLNGSGDWNDPSRFIVEAKTSTNPDEWGDPGTDEVPERVLVQAHHAMFVVNYALAYVPVLLPVFGRFDFRMYVVRRNDELAEMVARAGVDFMEKHVAPRIPPADFRPSLEVLKRMRRTPNRTVPVPTELAERWIVSRAARLQAEKDEELAQQELLAAIGDGDAASWGDGRLATYFEQVRRSIDTKLLEREHREIAEKCRRASACRVLRIKGAK
jgi:putative phage-type endonuclease